MIGQPQQQKCTSKAGYNYLLYVPSAEEQPSPWATVIFLHGAGERGADLDRLKKGSRSKLQNKLTT
jgi:predicted peptidase